MTRLFILLLLAAGFSASAQSHSLDSIYNPAANARQDMAAAVRKAAADNKHVLLQIGGNWCIWCRRLYKFVHDRPELLQEQDKNYVVYHLNYSKENKNLDILKELGFPQRFGFPVLVILDAKGRRLHTQNTALLESADSYDEKKIADMLRDWSPQALEPARYIEKR
ncbi:thioredoxin family protein [Chitinophaga lutea]